MLIDSCLLNRTMPKKEIDQEDIEEVHLELTLSDANRLYGIKREILADNLNKTRKNPVRTEGVKRFYHKSDILEIVMDIREGERESLEAEVANLTDKLRQTELDTLEKSGRINALKADNEDLVHQVSAAHSKGSGKSVPKSEYDTMAKMYHTVLDENTALKREKVEDVRTIANYKKDILSLKQIIKELGSTEYVPSSQEIYDLTELRFYANHFSTNEHTPRYLGELISRYANEKDVNPGSPADFVQRAIKEGGKNLNYYLEKLKDYQNDMAGRSILPEPLSIFMETLREIPQQNK